MSDSEERYKRACQQAIAEGKVRARHSRRGAIITGWPSRWPCHSEPRPHKRGIITSASVRSLIRGGWQIANSPADWSVMTTLTFRQAIHAAKDTFREWCERMVKAGVFGPQWGYVQEYQERGVVHYHVIHTVPHLEREWARHGLRWRKRQRGKRSVMVLSGLAEEFLVEEWLDCMGTAHPDAVAFNYGGIIEQMAKPELTGWYLGRYASKMAQKRLPEGEPPQGRWWWLSPEARPILGEETIVDFWPLEKPHKLLFDGRRIDPHLDSSALRNIPQ